MEHPRTRGLAPDGDRGGIAAIPPPLLSGAKLRFGFGSGVPLRLHLIESSVDAMVRHQFFMSPVFNDPAFAQDDDAIRHAHTTQTMGDEQAGSSLHQIAKAGVEV